MSLLLSFFSFQLFFPSNFLWLPKESMYIKISVVFFSSTFRAYMEIKFILLIELPGSQCPTAVCGELSAAVF